MRGVRTRCARCGAVRVYLGRTPIRFYDLTLTNASGQVYQPTATGGGLVLAKSGTTFTSFVNGRTIPGALNIEFDLPVIPFNTPQGSGIIRVWNVGLQSIGAAADLNGAKFRLQGGMKPGLPLATAAASQAGTLLQGTVYQAFGAWEGVDTHLDLICYPGELAPVSGIPFDWTQGVPLYAALRTTFAQAFPSYAAPIIQISPNLQPPKGQAQCGWYKNIGQFAQYLFGITQAQGQQLTNANYPGVQISIVGDQFYIYDGTQPRTTTQLNFQDIIGQPILD